MSREADIPSSDRIDFHHPFTPYEVQEQFMRTAYEVLQTGNGQIGILESPTGTGKSLSLICASLTWLRNYKSSEFEEDVKVLGKSFEDEPAWIVDQLLRQKRAELAQRWEEREKRLEDIRNKERLRETHKTKRRRLDNDDDDPRETGDDEWLLDENSTGENSERDVLSGLSEDTREVLARMGIGVKPKNDEDESPAENEIKIFYASRTHSQLSQFIAELRRPSFPSSLPESLIAQGNAEGPKSEPVKHIPLSSRQKLCINKTVSRLGSLQLINDRCAELQQAKDHGKCKYVPRDELMAQTRQFRDTALAMLPDIEDLHSLGKSLSICPYYASRAALPSAEIITLPYPLLLQNSAREALGIKLDGNVVIIDEAHNVMDAVTNVHAAEIRLSELKAGRQMLGVYVRKFGKRLKGENRVMVGRVAKVIDGLSDWLTKTLQSKNTHGIVDANTLVKHQSIDQINLFELIQYIQASKLAYKIEGYASQAQKENPTLTVGGFHASSPVLHSLVSFLAALTNLSFEGRLFYEKLDPSSAPDIKLSYLLLSPTHAFSSIASKARAVILAGGTMSPFEDYKLHLFPNHVPSKITTLSCGHVIPPSNLCVWTLAQSKVSPNTNNPGPNSSFEFSFQKRSDQNMVRDLGLALLNICTVVPDGVVAFFPSYGYLDDVTKCWQERKAETSSIWDRIAAKKVIFSESKGASSEDTLKAYSDAILTPENAPGDKPHKTGALLLSVVGGKMSEGINFSDRLGRCVVIIGLPYPNINSPEWKAKTEYVESTTLARLLEPDPSGAKDVPSNEAAKQMAKQAARDFYENACMRAVNQSIGRAIRHMNDYAAIVLLDRRYGTERIQKKLPQWIRSGMVADSHEKGLPQLMGALSKFFRDKRVTAQP